MGLQALNRFVSVDDCFKDAVTKMVPNVDKDAIETEYRDGLICPDCGDPQGSALFYRYKGDTEWNQASGTMGCWKCRDSQAFNLYQRDSLNQQKVEIGKRLTNEYFIIPDDLQEAGFANYNQTNQVTAKAKEGAKEYVKAYLKGDKYNLLMMGNPGTGKSHLCVAIARNLQSKGLTVGFITTGKLLAKIKGTYSSGAKTSEDKIMQDLKRFDLLILDDVGSESTSGKEDWRKSMIFEVVNSRVGKPTIYTSNLTDSDLPVAVGDRVFSRLYNNTKFIDLFTDDYRKNLLRK